MSLRNKDIDRRDFLRRSALAGMSLAANAIVPKVGYSASADRLTILTSVSLSSLQPYAYSSSPEYGIWNHMAESLVEVDYTKMGYVGVLAESWEFQGKKWVFNLRKGVRFHDGSPFTAKGRDPFVPETLERSKESAALCFDGHHGNESGG